MRLDGHVLICMHRLNLPFILYAKRVNGALEAIGEDEGLKGNV